jgi:predicted transcriptional regulator
MTIKELAGFTGKTEKTIQNWVKKANEKITLHNEKITLVKGQEINLTVEQVETVLNAGTMSKDAVSILMNNAREEL